MRKEQYRENCPGIEKVSLLGSKATGTYKSYSDIDLELYGNIDEAKADRLWTCFSESLLPYKVDIYIYRHINYPPLKRRIDQQGQILFTKEQLYRAGLCVSPERYVGMAETEDDFDFEERFTALKAEFEGQIKEEQNLNKRILENLAKVKLEKA